MKKRMIGDILWLSALLLVTTFLAVPNTNQLFLRATTAFPYPMGFLKFAILATMGELLAIRIAAGEWRSPAGLVYRMLVWGMIGVAITFMFAFYSTGVNALIGSASITTRPGYLSELLIAFLTSLIMNLTFGPVFMAAHRVSDTYIDLRMGGRNPSWGVLVRQIDWPDFVTFVVGKTIPLWWVPVHTITFLLPAEYRVVAAAYLSIVLGIILVSAKKRITKRDPFGNRESE